MPVDSEVAKERIWKEHCDKMVMQTIKFRQEGRSHAEFTLNPYHLQHNKPVTDSVSHRSPDFLDRSKASLAALSSRLAATGLSPQTGRHDDDATSPQRAARANKSRAVAGNNIFGSPSASPTSKRKLLEEWTEMLNDELGGRKGFRESMQPGFLPPINNKSTSPDGSPAANKQSSPARELSPAAQPASPSQERDARDRAMQELLLRSSKPPTQKYERPLTESQVLGWEVHRAPRPNEMFHFGIKMCEMTRFASESGQIPSKKAA